MSKRDLNRAFRQPCCIGDCAETCGDRFPFVPRSLAVKIAETRVVLFTAEGDEKRIGSFMNMSYTCDDIDKTYAELKKRGVEFEGPPQTQPWGRYVMFKDSEGNRFVVSSE